MNETPHPNQYPSQTQPPQPPPYRQLRRSEHDRMVAGVCAGVADYLRVDPTLIRVGFAVLAIITWGVALLAYVIAWAVMPPAAAASPPAPHAPPPAGRPQPHSSEEPGS